MREHAVLKTTPAKYGATEGPGMSQLIIESLL